MKRHWPAIICLLLSACTLVAAPQATATSQPSPSSTPLPSPTVVWFPPTSTPTARPTPQVTPTREMDLETGEILYRDRFQSRQRWSIPTSNRGEINIANGEMNIIIKEPQTFLFSETTKRDFTNFYAEITASPSLCSGKDEYGLMFRSRGMGQHYRFSLSCDGEVRLDRILGQSALSLQPWVPSASVPSAAPSQSRLGVWAVEDEFHLFVNGTHQFSITDQEISQGSLGLFARAVGETAVTVSFSDLVVRRAFP